MRNDTYHEKARRHDLKSNESPRDPTWPDPELIRLYIQEAEQMRAQAIARGVGRAARAMGKLSRRIWHAVNERQERGSRPRMAD